MIHECSTCRAKRKTILKIDPDDSSVYERIINGIETARMAYKNKLPDNLRKDEIIKYYEKIINDEIYYLKLNREWWRFISNKFNIKINDYIKVDTLNYLLFHCLDSNGNEILE
jgi:hypothetical protein